MDSLNLEQLRECCDNNKVYFIIYDGGNKPDVPVLVCKSCLDNLVFRQHIKSKKEIVTTSSKN
ncbi:MAG: hypothetical protein ACK4TO_09835 [Candidatus Nitrosotenuis sp.]